MGASVFAPNAWTRYQALRVPGIRWARRVSRHGLFRLLAQLHDDKGGALSDGGKEGEKEKGVPTGHPRERGRAACQLKRSITLLDAY